MVGAVTLLRRVEKALAEPKTYPRIGKNPRYIHAPTPLSFAKGWEGAAG
jgi:hypothetical protein